MADHILKSLNRTLLFPAAALLSLSLAAGCGADDRQVREEPRSNATSDTASVDTYVATGRIMSITPDRDFVMVRHDAIDGFMDAMTMPFGVSDTGVVSGIAAGDSVRFMIEASGGEIKITSIEPRP